MDRRDSAGDRVRPIANAVRNAPLAASALVRRLRDDPARLRTALEARYSRGAGRSFDVDASSDPRAIRSAARAAIGARDLESARSFISLLPAGEPATAQLLAEVARVAGDYDEALRLTEPTAGGKSSSGLRRVRRAVTEDVAGLAPTTSRPAGHRSYGYEPVTDRVLHVVTNSVPYVNAGYTIRTQQIALAQRRSGLDAHVMTRLGFPVIQGHLTAPTSQDVEGVPHHRLLPVLPPSPSGAATARRQLDEASRLVEELRPMVLHAATNYLNGELAAALRERHGTPFVYEVRGFLEDSWASRQPDEDAALASQRYVMTRAAETAVMNAADAVTTLGSAMRDEIVARGVDPERVFVTPNAIDESWLDEAASDENRAALDRRGQAIRARLGIAPTETTVGVISTLHEFEGVPTLLRALAVARDRGAAGGATTLHGLVVGDGPELASIKRLVDELGLASSVSVVGRVPFAEIRDWYAAIDVFCVPRVAARVTELVTPLKPIEAMALGRAVVASDVGGLSELITHEVTGLLVDPSDPKAWAAALERASGDPELRRELGDAARQQINEQRTWGAVVDIQRSVYSGL